MIGTPVLTFGEGGSTPARAAVPSPGAAGGFAAVLSGQDGARKAAGDGAGAGRARDRQDRRRTGAEAALAPDLTALSVRELASHGPVKATVAQARAQQVEAGDTGTGEEGAVRQPVSEEARPVRAGPQRQEARVPTGAAAPVGRRDAEPTAAKAESAPERPQDQPADPQPKSPSETGTPAESPVSAGGAAPVAGATVAPASSANATPAPSAAGEVKGVTAAERVGRSEPKAATPKFRFEKEDRLAAQAARGLAAAIRQGRGSVTLRLTPEALGDLKVRVELTEARVQATFEVETDQARQLLDKSLGDLRAALEARGLEVDRLDVRVADRAGHTPHAQGQDSPFGGAGGQMDGGAGQEQGSPGQDARGSGPAGTVFGMERTPPPPLAEGAAHGARWTPEWFIEPGGDPQMRVRLDAVA